jgi:hypothetical protein
MVGCSPSDHDPVKKHSWSIVPDLAASRFISSGP